MTKRFVSTVEYVNIFTTYLSYVKYVKQVGLVKQYRSKRSLWVYIKPIDILFLYGPFKLLPNTYLISEGLCKMETLHDEFLLFVNMYKSFYPYVFSIILMSEV